jgi:hypothetical protein
LQEQAIEAKRILRTVSSYHETFALLAYILYNQTHFNSKKKKKNPP